jgi:hypothetical protein
MYIYIYIYTYDISHNISSEQLFVYIMGCMNQGVVKALSGFVWKAFQVREIELTGVN